MPTRTAFDLTQSPPGTCGLVLIVGPATLAQPIASALRRVDPGCVVALDAHVRSQPSLVLITSVGRGDRATAGHWLSHGVEHLPVTVGADRFVIGPLVRPGGGPCLQCVDLRVRDGLACAAVTPAAVSAAAPDPDPGVVALAASSVALIAGAVLAGSAPRGVSLEAMAPWPRTIQRRWSAHPLCPCGAWESGLDLPEQNQTNFTDRPLLADLAG